MNDLVHALSKPETEEKLFVEITLLAGIVLEVDANFSAVIDLFKKVKTSTNDSGLIKDIDALMGAYESNHTMFVNLLWVSRQVAGEAQALTDYWSLDFVVYLTDDDVSLEDKKSELKSYAERLMRHGSDSVERLKQGFFDLQKNLEAFTRDWEAIAKNHHLNLSSPRVEELNDIIKSHANTLNDLYVKTMNLAEALRLLSTSSSGSRQFFQVCPSVWVGSLFNVLGVAAPAILLKKAVDEKETVIARLSEYRSERALQASQLPAIKALGAGIDLAYDGFNNIVERLSSFTHVWESLRADILRVEELLDVENTVLLEAHLHTSAKVYATLGQALRVYQQAVNLPAAQ
ncbi:hypothetical protein EUX98_g7872 [Antrodiella citrinella]|uniref:Uncharacterized protein n=1 Tax=Antrodiella citrinella TaxID=2447956 RepID=A0A4S4MKG7_9APHY|nr:hypothetical protein EUX98_g7872 [Antrodiella citrinella]